MYDDIVDAYFENQCVPFACLKKHTFDILSLRCVHVADFFLEFSASKFSFNRMVEIWVADKITYYPQWTWPKWVVPYPVVNVFAQIWTSHVHSPRALCAFTVSSRIMQAAKAKPTNVAIQTTPIAIPRAGTKKRAAAQTKNGYLGQKRSRINMFLFADLLGLLDCGIWTGRVLGHVHLLRDQLFMPTISLHSCQQSQERISTHITSIITWLLHWIALNYIELYWIVWVQGVMMSSGPLLKPGCGMGLWGLQHTGIRFDILLILLLLRFKRVWWHSKIT